MMLAELVPELWDSLGATPPVLPHLPTAVGGASLSVDGPGPVTKAGEDGAAGAPGHTVPVDKHRAAWQNPRELSVERAKLGSGEPMESGGAQRRAVRPTGERAGPPWAAQVSVHPSESPSAIP